MIQHMFADQFKIKPEDYDSIRVTFRKLEGNWEELCLGSPEELKRLQDVILAWGSLDHDKKGEALV